MKTGPKTLAIFLLTAISGKKRIKAKYLIVVLIISVIYAISDEFHQLFIPGRSGSISDIIIDLSGILFSILVYSVSRIKK